MLTLRKVNDAVRAETSQYVELVKGDGYFYFVYDDGKRYSTASVCVNSLNQLPLTSWLYEAKNFYATIETIRNLQKGK